MPYGTSIGWNNLLSNQAVSWDDLHDAVVNWYYFSAGTNYSSMPTGNREVYKSLPTYVLTTYINTTLNSSRASNDLLIKSDFSPIWDHTSTMYTSNTIDGAFITGGWSSSSAACSNGPSQTGTNTIPIGWNGTLGSTSYYIYETYETYDNWVLINDSGSPTYLYLSSGNWVYMPYYYPSSSDGQVTSTGTCVITTTTTSTTTTTTTTPTARLAVYGKMSNTFGGPYYMYWSLDGATWTILSTALTTSCQFLGYTDAETVGTTFYIGSTNVDPTSGTFYTNVTTGGSCPATVTDCAHNNITTSTDGDLPVWATGNQLFGIQC